jgi:large subunit ribosomal protein L5
MAKNKDINEKKSAPAPVAKEAKVKQAKDTAGESVPKDYKPRLKAAYKDKILPALVKELGLSTPMAAPKLVKIVLNVGVSEARENISALETAADDLARITGQAPQTRRAKKSISNFKLRENMPIGVRVTLRSGRMYEFMDRFVSIACPRIRDFRGFDPKCFDGRGNLNIGLKEQMIFPEIDVEKSPKAHGMNITFVTTADDDKGGRALLELMGIPFRKPEKTAVKA